jgi:hypothetical protein
VKHDTATRKGPQDDQYEMIIIIFDTRIENKKRINLEETEEQEEIKNTRERARS